MGFMVTCQTTNVLARQTLFIRAYILSRDHLCNVPSFPQIAEADSVKAAVQSAGKKKPYWLIN